MDAGLAYQATQLIAHSRHTRLDCPPIRAGNLRKMDRLEERDQIVNGIKQRRGS